MRRFGSSHLRISNFTSKHIRELMEEIGRQWCEDPGEIKGKLKQDRVLLWALSKKWVFLVRSENLEYLKQDL
jgi:hypothetical protein